MRGRLFEYAVLYHPNLTARSVMEGLGAGEIESKKSELIVGPKTAIATSEEEVRTIAGREIPEEHLDKLQQVEILIRPFA